MAVETIKNISGISACLKLGKGEVLSSILSGSTRKAHGSRAFRITQSAYPATRYATKREHDISIRGKSVDFDRRLFARPDANDQSGPSR